jgi:ribosomal protein L37E
MIRCPRCGSTSMHLEERAEGSISAYCVRCGTLAKQSDAFCERCGKVAIWELFDAHRLCAQCRELPSPT